MSARARFLWLLLAWTSLPTATLSASEPAAGEPQPVEAEVTIDDVLALLNERSAALRAERLTVEVVRAGERTAKTIPNPVASAQLIQTVAGDVDSFNGTQPQVTIEQPIPIAGQRRARMAHARRETARAEAEAALYFERAAVEVRRAFVTLLVHQRRVELLDAAVVALEEAAMVVRGRAAAGDRSRYDTLRIEVERQSVEVALLEARADVEAEARSLAAALGMADFRPRAVGELAPAPLHDGSASGDVHPAIELSRRQVAAAAAAVRLARREAVPTPTLGAGAAFTTQRSATAAYVGLSIPLPLFDRNQGRIAEARAEARVAEARRQATVTALETSLQRAERSLAQRAEALERFEAGVYATLPDLGAMAEAAYRSGATSILEVVDSLRTRRELELEHLGYLEAVKQAEIDLLAAHGRAGATP